MQRGVGVTAQEDGRASGEVRCGRVRRAAGGVCGVGKRSRRTAARARAGAAAGVDVRRREGVKGTVVSFSVSAA